MASVESDLQCRRFDLSTPACVFGGLLIASTALCTLEASSGTGILVEEVQVAVDESPNLSPSDVDIVGSDCEPKSQGSQSEPSKRCTPGLHGSAMTH